MLVARLTLWQRLSHNIERLEVLVRAITFLQASCLFDHFIHLNLMVCSCIKSSRGLPTLLSLG